VRAAVDSELRKALGLIKPEPAAAAAEAAAPAAPAKTAPPRR
jgi:hypothetical protein